MFHAGKRCLSRTAKTPDVRDEHSLSHRWSPLPLLPERDQAQFATVDKYKRGFGGIFVHEERDTMQLVEVQENAVTVELDWADVRYLAFIIRHAIRHDVGSTTHEPTMVVTYAETAEAFLLAGGMAGWAQTVREEKYDLERFLEVVPITREEWQAEQERFGAARREREHKPSTSARAEAPPAA